MSRRILHIIPTLDRAGAEKQLALLTTNLPRDRFDVHVCALTRGGPLEVSLKDAGIPYTLLGKRWKADPLAYARLRKHVARLRPELIHTWLFAGGAYGRAAGKALGVKHLVHGERCVDLWKSGWQWMVDRRFAKSTDRIVANTSGVKQFCIEHGLPSEKLDVIANGISVASMNTRPVARGTLFEELDIPNDAKLIGVVGRLWPQKRVKDLIWAYELVVVLHPTARLLIIGDGPERGRLERFARLTSTLDRVRFLGHRKDVGRIMPHLDVLWNGSGYEGMPNSVMEAMAARVPVVATNIPGNWDLVVPNKTGYLVPIASRADFGRATDKILSDAALARTLGEAGRRRIEKEFSVARMVDQYAALYAELLG